MNNLIDFKSKETVKALIAQVTAKNGMALLNKIKEDIKNGEKVVKKHRTQAGSKEFKLAMFPIPKKAIHM